MSSDELAFDLSGGPARLAQQIVDIESVSGAEEHLADRIEATLRGTNHLEVVRIGNTVAARTALGRDHRVIIAGHIDTVPISGALPSRVEEGVLYGRGSVDMKAGVANHLILAVELESSVVDVTWIFYDQEEVESDKNGLGHFHAAVPEWMQADFAVLGEPSNGGVEGGCNGTLRVRLTSRGVAAHSARPWMGDNAIHKLGNAIATLNGFQPESRVVDGLAYRESLSAVGIAGGIAGNVVPDEASLTVNFRFAPDRSVEEAIELVSALFPGYEIEVVDQAAGARPGLDGALAGSLVSASGRAAEPKYGWTDVARFSALGIPAVNFGPGNPALAHAANEHVEIAEIDSSYATLRAWLSPQ